MNVLEELLISDRDWSLINKIAANPADNILQLVQERYEKCSAKQKNNLIWLVGELQLEGSHQLLLDWFHSEIQDNRWDLEGDRAGNIADILYVLTSHKVAAPHEELINLLTNRSDDSRVSFKLQ